MNICGIYKVKRKALLIEFLKYEDFLKFNNFLKNSNEFININFKKIIKPQCFKINKSFFALVFTPCGKKDFIPLFKEFGICGRPKKIDTAKIFEHGKRLFF